MRGKPVQYRIDVFSVKAVCRFPCHVLVTSFSYGEEHRCQTANLQLSVTVHVIATPHKITYAVIHRAGITPP